MSMHIFIVSMYGLLCLGIYSMKHEQTEDASLMTECSCPFSVSSLSDLSAKKIAQLGALYDSIHVLPTELQKKVIESMRHQKLKNWAYLDYDSLCYQQCDVGEHCLASVAWNHNSRTVATGSCLTKIFIFKSCSESLKTLTSFEAHNATIHSVIFHHDRCKLISASADATIKLWDIEHEKPILTFQERGSVSALALHPCHEFFCSCARNDITMWDMRVQPSSKSLGHHEDPVFALDCHSRGVLLASGSADHTVKIWDLRKLKGPLATYEHGSPVYVVKFSPINKNFMFSGSDEGIELRELVDDSDAYIKMLKNNKGFNTGAVSLSCHPEENIIAWDGNKSITVWNVDTEEIIKVISSRFKKGGILGMAFSDKGEDIAVVSTGLEIWKADDREIDNDSYFEFQ